MASDYPFAIYFFFLKLLSDAFLVGVSKCLSVKYIVFAFTFMLSSNSMAIVEILDYIVIF